MKGLCLSYIPKENPRRISFLIGLVSNSENFPNQPEYACRSTGRSTDPSTGRPCLSTVPNRELGNVSRSTGRSTALLLRSTGRSIATACARLCTLVHTGRPGRSTGPLLLLLLLLIRCFLVIVDFLDFLAISSLSSYTLLVELHLVNR